MLREAAETLLLAAGIFLVVQTTTGRFRIDGESMEPSMHHGQYVLVNKLSYRFHPPQRGEVIVFHFGYTPDPDPVRRLVHTWVGNSERDFIKRVIGLPGDTVEIGGGQVRVNGMALSEPYISAPPDYAGTWTLGPSEYFVLGDNRNASDDSHIWGSLNADAIVGKAWFTYWPPDYWGPVVHADYHLL